MRTLATVAGAGRGSLRPEPRRRGIVKDDYRGTTLRENLGLAD